MINHPIEPFFDENSNMLILGSFPSVKSREQKFFYGHAQNRFWKVISAIFRCDCPVTVEEKKHFLRKCRIALWDVIASCEITGSSDSSIKNATANDLRAILDHADIEKIFVNGRTAEKLYKAMIAPDIGRPAIYLPSTSPANAAFSLEKLIYVWGRAFEKPCS